MVAKNVIFSGRVQGVGFRFTVHRIAGRYQLTGWVRNLPDGNVEMVAQGPAEDVDACLADIQENFGGYVRDTRITDVPVDPRHISFKITY